MATKSADRVGMSYGYLVVEERGPDYVSPKGNPEHQFWCRCACGARVLVRITNLNRSGPSRRCRRTWCSALPPLGYKAAHSHVGWMVGKASLKVCVDADETCQGRLENSYNGGAPDEMTELYPSPSGAVREVRYSMMPAYYSVRCLSHHRRHDLEK